MKIRALMLSLTVSITLLASAPYATPTGLTYWPPRGVGQSASQPVPRLEASFIATETSGTLFENVTRVMQSKYFDERFRTVDLPKLIAQYSEKAKNAVTLREQRDVCEELLSHVPSSHLGLISRTTHHYVACDLEGRKYPMFGFELIQINSKYYAFGVLEGGPAARAGVLSWDRIVSIDGIPSEKSPRVDWRSDDAYIPDDRDPPVHYLITNAGDVIKMKIERRAGKFVEVSIPAEEYSAFAAAKASIHKIESNGSSIGYVHFWYVHLAGVPELLKSAFDNELSDCNALVVDLRGRGGNGMAIARIVDVLKTDHEKRHRPIVALIDRQSRSAKDVLAYEFKNKNVARLVGEPTAGAVIPASFADVGHDTILMFPTFKLPRYTDLLEHKPVDPDVLVPRAGPLSAGDDPILKAGVAEAAKLAKQESK